MPRKAHPDDAGYDLASREMVVVHPGDVRLAWAGFRIALEHGWEAQIRSRSGNVLKKRLVVANSPGTIDCGYLGEVGVLLHNIGSKMVVVNPGDRIAQMVVCRVPNTELEQVKSIDEQSSRGANGFGSTDEKGV